MNTSPYITCPHLLRRTKSIFTFPPSIHHITPKYIIGGQTSSRGASRGEVPKEAGGDAGPEEAEQGPVRQDGPVPGPDSQSGECQQGGLVVVFCGL